MCQIWSYKEFCMNLYFFHEQKSNSELIILNSGRFDFFLSKSNIDLLLPLTNYTKPIAGI